MYRAAIFSLSGIARFSISLVSVLAGFTGAVLVMGALQFRRSGGPDASRLIHQYFAAGPGRLVLLLYLAFGLPHLLSNPSAAFKDSKRKAAAAAIATGISMALGISLLSAGLNYGAGNPRYIFLNLLFGAIAAFTTLLVFHSLAGGEKAAPLPPIREPAASKRIAVSLLSLAAGCAVPCLLVLAGSILFDRDHSPVRWFGIDYFFVVFALAGYFLFGLPILVLGPLRRRFTSQISSALAGGGAAIVLVELYVRNTFAFGNSGLFPGSLLFDLACSTVAFSIGAVTAFLYVRFRDFPRFPGDAARP